MITKAIIIALFISQLSITLYGQFGITVEHRVGAPNIFSKSGAPIFAGESGSKTRNDMTTNFDLGTLILCQYPIWKKRKVYIIGGFEWSQTKTTLDIVDVKFERTKYNLPISHKRIALHLGIKKEFEILPNKFYFSLGFNVVKRFHYKGTTNITNDWFEYDQYGTGYWYDVNLYYDQRINDIERKTSSNRPYFYINANMNMAFTYSITRNWQLGLSLSYTRNNYFYFDYENKYFYKSTSPGQASNVKLDYVSTTGRKFAMRDNFLYTGITVGYIFNKKENTLPKL